MTRVRITAVAENFGRDLELAFDTIASLLRDAREDGVQLLVLPEATLGGYLADLSGDPEVGLPPAFELDGPEIRRLSALAGDIVVTAGYCERDGDVRYNAAVCVDGSGVLGNHRKVHQPLREDLAYSPGAGFDAFDTPVGRLGMLICYDKAFPESARALALDGAQIVACMSAWPGARTAAAEDLEQDRWKRRFDLFDRARALENQVVWASANQAGTFGSLRFVASAKIVDPGGEIIADTGVRAGTATATVDVEEALTMARRAMFHLGDRRPDTYAAAVA